MLARVAATLYWLGRYLERVEDLTRLIGVNATLMLDLPKGIAPGWSQILHIISATDAYTASHGDDYSESHVLQFLLADQENPLSTIHAAKCARENARTIREILPSDAWEGVNALYHYALDCVHLGLSKRSRYQYLKQMISRCQTLAGAFSGTMNRDHGYLFLRVGYNLERADMTSRIVDVRSANLLINIDSEELRPFDSIQWKSVLESLGGYQMYRQAMEIQVVQHEVLRFLIASPVFPRSIYRSIARCNEDLEAIGSGIEAQQIANRTLRAIGQVDFQSLGRETLHQFVDRLQIEFVTLNDVISRLYFLAR